LLANHIEEVLDFSLLLFLFINGKEMKI